MRLRKQPISILTKDGTSFYWGLRCKVKECIIIIQNVGNRIRKVVRINGEIYTDNKFKREFDQECRMTKERTN